MLSTIKTKLHMGFFTFLSRQKFFLSTIFLLSGMVSVFAQCPTVVDDKPSFCDSETSTVARLNASVTDGGSGIAWYADLVGGVALPSTTSLKNATDYYVDQAVGSCGIRQKVTVTILFQPSVGSQDPFWPFCLKSATEKKTIQDGLDKNIIVESNLKFYNSAFASAKELFVTDEIKNKDIVWIAQVNPKTGCETVRRPIRVDFTFALTPEFISPTPICLIPGDPEPTLSNLSVGIGNTFYKDLITTTPEDPSITKLVDGDIWYVSYNEAPCESDRVPVEVKLNPKPKDIIGEPLQYCENNVTTSDIVLFDQFKTEVPEITGTWSTTATVAAPTTYNGAINISTLTQPGSYTYTYEVDLKNNCPPQKNTVTIEIIKKPFAGFDGTVTFCSTGEDGLNKDLTTHLKPDALGVLADAGGTWTGPSPIVGGIYDPATMLPGNYEYTVTAEPCAFSKATVTVTEQEQVKVGTAKNITLCENELGALPLVSLFAQLEGETDPSGVWTTDSGVIMGGVDNLRTVDVNTFTVQNSPYSFTYTVTPGGVCNPVPRTIQITIDEFIKAGDDTSTAICSNSTPVDLVTRIPGATPGGTWTLNGNPHSGTFDPAIDVAGIYTYTATNQKCKSSDADLTVTIDPFVDPGISAAPRQICVTNVATTAPINLFAQLGGTPVNTGTWSGPVGITIQPDSTIDISGYDTTSITQLTSLVFTYTVGALPTSCPNTSTVTIIIEPLPNPGEDVVAPVIRCANGGNLDLTTLLGGNPQTHGTWSFNGNPVVNPIDLATAQSGEYRYTITPVDCAGGPEIATLTLNIQPVLSPGTDAADLTYCVSNLPAVNPVNLFERLGGNKSTGGTWTPSNGVQPAGGHLGTVNVRNLQAGTYTFNYVIAASNGCTGGQSTATIIVTADPKPGILSSQPAQLCSNSTLNLFDQLIGEDAGGTWTEVNTGNIVANGILDPAIHSAGGYRYVVSNASCGSRPSPIVNVTIEQAPKVGTGTTINYCVTQLGTLGSMNLFDQLTGEKENTGTWTSSNGINPQGQVGTINLDALQQGRYEFLYQITGGAICGVVSSSVVISIDPRADAGTPKSVDPTEVCTSDAPFDLTTLINLVAGQPQGVWTEVATSNVIADGMFNPASSAAGVYRYTVTSIGCNETKFVEVTINKIQAPNAGADNTTTRYCIDNKPNTVNLYDLLADKDGVRPEITGTWSPLTSVTGTGNNAILDISTFTAGSYTYNYSLSNAKCTSIGGVTIIIEALPDAGAENSNNKPFCSNEGNIDLNTLLTGAQTGGVWTYNDNSAPISNTLNLATAQSGKYTYTVNPIACVAAPDFTDIQITIQQAPNVGNSLEPVTRRVCVTNVNTTSINLFNEFTGATATNGTWTSSPAISGTGNNAILNLSGFAVGSYTYTYTVLGTGACSTTPPTTRDVIVIVETDKPNSGTPISVKNIVCPDQSSFDLFTLLDINATRNGEWTYNTLPVSNIFDPASSKAGIYTYTAKSISCGNVSAPPSLVDIEIRSVVPALASIRATAVNNKVCQGTSSTINLVGTPDAVVTYNTGDGVDKQVALVNDGSGVGRGVINTGILNADVTYTVTAIAYPGVLSCSQPVSANAKITLKVESNNPKAGNVKSVKNIVCPTQGEFDLINLIENYTSTDGKWTYSDNTEIANGKFNPATDNAGVYTYTVISESCGGISNDVKVTIEKSTITPVLLTVFPEPNDTKVCLGATKTIALTGTPDAVVTYNNGDGTDKQVVLDATGNGEFTTTAITAPVVYTITAVSYPGFLTCSTVISSNNKINLSVETAPVATITGSTTICEGSNATITLNGDANATVTYKIGTGAEQTQALGAAGKFAINLTNVTDNVTYTLVKVTSATGCDQVLTGQFATVTVNKFITPAISGIGGTANPVCNGSKASIKIEDNINNEGATLTYKIGETGADQTVVLNANGGAMIETLALTSSTDFRLLKLEKAGGSGLCFKDLNIPLNVIQITVNDLPTVKTFKFDNGSNTKSVCPGGSLSINVEGIPSSTVYYKLENIENLAEQSIQIGLDAKGVIDLNNIQVKTIVKITKVTTTTGTVTCENVIDVTDTTLTLTIEVVALPTLPTATVSVSDKKPCFNKDVTVQIAGATELIGRISEIKYTLSGAVVLKDEKANVTFDNSGNTSFVIPASKLTQSGLVTVKIDEISFTENCRITTLSAQAVNFTINDQIATPTLVAKGNSYCAKEAGVLTLLNLSSRVVGVAGMEVVWYASATDKAELPSSTLLADDTTYYVAYKNSNSCIGETRLAVTVDTDRCLDVPSAFTPNGDGINETFIIKNIEFLYPNYELEIYNRYGNVLHKQNINTLPWSGSAGHGRVGADEKLPTGVYFYILTFNGDDNREPVQGVIYLSRE